MPCALGIAPGGPAPGGLRSGRAPDPVGGPPQRVVGGWLQQRLKHALQGGLGVRRSSRSPDWDANPAKSPCGSLVEPSAGLAAPPAPSDPQGSRPGSVVVPGSAFFREESHLTQTTRDGAASSSVAQTDRLARPERGAGSRAFACRMRERARGRGEVLPVVQSESARALKTTPPLRASASGTLLFRGRRPVRVGG